MTAIRILIADIFWIHQPEHPRDSYVITTPIRGYMTNLEGVRAVLDLIVKFDESRSEELHNAVDEIFGLSFPNTEVAILPAKPFKYQLKINGQNSPETELLFEITKTLNNLHGIPK